MAYCGPRGIPLSQFLQWSQDDQSYALSWLALDRAKCSRCGTSDWEWEADHNAYQAEPFVCLGCNRIEQTQKDNEETAKHLPGMQIRLMKGGGGDG